MKYIGYNRVSTTRQGQSGLGLEAQRRVVKEFIKADKSRKLLGEYTDVESGKRDTRPQLLNAIKHCKATGAVLLIAKLDRLSRNVAFIFTLRDTKVEFKALDLPDANTLTVGLFAAIAQHERELISQRTKSALAVLKSKGVFLGTPRNLTDDARLRATKAIQNKAMTNKDNLQALELIKDKRRLGLTYVEIALKLNQLGYTTSLGNTFHAITVRKLNKRSQNWSFDC